MLDKCREGHVQGTFGFAPDTPRVTLVSNPRRRVSRIDAVLAEPTSPIGYTRAATRSP
ncbi:MAG: hypothetical protein ACRDSH_11515 [Pseudonocardiaceae bacterium]